MHHEVLIKEDLGWPDSNKSLSDYKKMNNIYSDWNKIKLDIVFEILTKNGLLSEFNVSLDITDKSLIDFKKTKSISIASSIADLKSSKIGELYDVKPVHDNMQRLCQNKIQSKSLKTTPISKSNAKK